MNKFYSKNFWQVLHNFYTSITLTQVKAVGLQNLFRRTQETPLRQGFFMFKIYVQFSDGLSARGKFEHLTDDKPQNDQYYPGDDNNVLTANAESHEGNAYHDRNTMDE